MFLKLHKNSFSDKRHWSPDFHKADLVGLEMGKKKKKVPDHRARLLNWKYNTIIKTNLSNLFICFDEIVVTREKTQIWSQNIDL